MAHTARGLRRLDLTVPFILGGSIEVVMTLVLVILLVWSRGPKTALESAVWRVLIYAPTGSAATSAAAFAAGDPIASTDASVAAASATSSLRNVAILGLSTTSGRPRR